MDNSDIEKRIESLIQNEFSYKLVAPGYRQRMRMVLRGVNPKKGEKVLDIGCDEGEYSSMLTDLGAKVVGLDIDKDSLKYAIQRAKDRKQKIHFLLADAQNLPFKPGVFDKAFSTEVLEHVERDHDAVSEMSRVLKDRGEGVIEVPMEMPFFRDPINSIAKKLGMGPIRSLGGYAWGHYRHYTPKQIKELANKNGFNVLEVKRFNNSIISLVQMYWPELFTFVVLPRVRKGKGNSKKTKKMPKRALYKNVIKVSDMICRLDERVVSTKSGALRVRVRKK